MKLGVFTTLMSDMPLKDACKYFKSIGCDMIEIGCGGYPGNAHADPEKLLNDEKAFQEFMATIKDAGLEVSALSCHGNPVHPQKELAEMYDKTIRNTILLAEKMGLHQINTFSGCPGDCPDSKYPNWVTCPWPEDFLAILDWQWNQKLIPYWKETGKFCSEHGVRIAFEMHPGFCVYNPETLLKLRAAVGDVIGANFDPSHLIWQGMDPVAAIRELKGAIYHVHAKDTKIDKYNTAKNGVLDTKHYGDEIHRAWVFRTVGYGNNETYWRDLVSNLRLCGYDRVLSIEHEDSLMTIDEGLAKAVSFLKDIVIYEEKPTTMSWA